MMPAPPAAAVVPQHLHTEIKSLIQLVGYDYLTLELDEHFATSSKPDKGKELQQQGNVARASASITGEKGFKFSESGCVAFSSNSAVPKRSQDFIRDLAKSVQPGQHESKNHEWLTGQAQSDNHTEPKILVAFQAAFQNQKPDKLSGWILIVSSRDVCSSCQNLIQSFSSKFPHVMIYTIGLGQDKDPHPEAMVRGLSVFDDIKKMQKKKLPSEPTQALIFQAGSCRPVGA